MSFLNVFLSAGSTGNFLVLTECVSVIIPAYNAERFIAQSVNSVVSQSYQNVECIVIDDGSTDNTRSIAESFDNVSYYYQSNAERSVARNNGINISTGSYVAFLDPDDYLSPSKIADQVAFLEQNHDVDVVYSNVMFFREEQPDSFFSLNRMTPSGDILEPLLYGNFITVHAPLIRKSALDRAGGFNPVLSHNEDWEFFLRLALSGARFGFINSCHAFCRMHESNTSRDEIRMHESKWQVVRQFVSEHTDELCRKGIDIRQVLSYHEADFGKALIANGRSGDGRRHIFDACRLPFPHRGKYLMFALFSYFLGPRICARFGGGVYRDKKDET